MQDERAEMEQAATRGDEDAAAWIAIEEAAVALMAAGWEITDAEPGSWITARKNGRDITIGA